MTFGEKIKQARIEKGLTKKQLSMETGLTEKTIASYENHGAEPQFLSACCLADVLDLSLEYLAGWEDSIENFTVDKFINKLYDKYAKLYFYKQLNKLNPEMELIWNGMAFKVPDDIRKMNIDYIDTSRLDCINVLLKS